MGGRSSLYVTTLLSLITIGAITWPEVTTSLNGPVTLRGEYYEENYFYGENTDSAVLSKATILKSCWCKKKRKKERCGVAITLATVPE